MEILCVLAGVLYAYTKHSYLLIALFFVFIQRPLYRFPACFAAGCMYAWIHAWSVNAYSEAEIIPKAEVTGYVLATPNVSDHRTQFQFYTDTLDGKKFVATLLLSWYNNPPPIVSGQYWTFTVKLKKPRNFGNPGAYDYQRAFIAKHIIYKGFIKAGSQIPVQTSKPWFMRGFLLRESLGNQLAYIAPNMQTASIVQALSLGLTAAISQDDWALFRRTGTTHLMVISGAHIGLVAGLIFSLMNYLWRCSAVCCLLWPAQRIASIFGIFTALSYSLIAGFAVPAQRSLLACCFGFFRFCADRRFSGWQGWRYGLLFVLIIEPHAVLMPGFYLSFLAVVILILVNNRWRLKGYYQTLAMQVGCLVGLMPLTIYWFSYGSLTGFFANLFAIPLVGFLIVPLSLCNLLLAYTDLALTTMKICQGLVWILMWGLTLVDNFSSINLDIALPHILFPLAMMSALFILVILPSYTFGLASFILIICACFPPIKSILKGEVIIRILDVGQGLAVFIQTAKHALLYDAGDKFHGGSDMGKMVILPVMKIFRVKSFNKIIISHPDKDHYGGLLTLESTIPTGEFIVNNPAYYQRGIACHTYPAWEWDNVQFRFFPIRFPFKDKNNTSCILQVTSFGKSMLLTGDIEKAGEYYLVETYGKQLTSEILLVGHHGSKTSSALSFIEKVAPQYAIASTGFDNRYKFPHPRIVETYHNLGIDFYNTALTGMVTAHFTKKGICITPESRKSHFRTKEANISSCSNFKRCMQANQEAIS